MDNAFILLFDLALIVGFLLGYYLGGVAHHDPHRRRR